ncbi:hypothetical protein F2Q70_00043516 [Brassica cretica]|uniref:Proteasome subunit alpha type n=1 Tax=Brassica cretica TaxID=69181 RepID=A0A8S9KP37_BRACR|nr:hypothetical protein F2Q70_00043516 [Brassica cretica]
MSRRYDSRTTIFSPEGRLYQVEYAMEAIGNAGSAIGILAKDGVVLIGEKKVTSKLLQTSTSAEKMYKIDDHVACAVAGIMSDANILINTARVQAQRYTFMYQEPMPVEQLVQSLCDTKQGYTQFGGLRPFGLKQPQKPWAKDKIWMFKSNPVVFGSPMFDAVLNDSSLDRELLQWLRSRRHVFQATWDS